MAGSLILWALVVSCATQAQSQQRVRFPNPSQPPAVNSFGGPPVANGNGQSATPWVQVPAGQGAALAQQIQPFDPYADPAQRFGNPAGAPQPTYGLPPTMPSAPGTIPGNSPPALPPNAMVPNNVPVFPSGVPLSGAAGTTLPPTLPPVYQPYAQPPPLGGPVTPVVPIVPQPVFPEGLQYGEMERLFQDTGMLYTFLYGQSGNDLQINEFDVFTSMIWKDFFHTPHDLRLTPGFTFDFLDGPALPGEIDLPSTLYAAYLNALWQPQLTPQFGVDLNLRVGVYSDFNTVTNDSIRIIGRGLGVLQMTPSSAIKLGIEYLDRVDIQILPAGGIYWEPNSQTRVDLYFPKPKFSRYWTTRGNTEYWWHLGAEYGGGSWTIDRIDTGASQRLDINDIRVFIGTDWNYLDRFDGVFDIGYVFDRQIYVKGRPDENLDLSSTFMLRAGMRF